MGRPRKTTAERRAERFSMPYRIGKASTGLKEEDIAELVNLSTVTLRRYRKDPGLFPVGVLATIGTALGWSEADYIAVLFPQGLGG